LKITNDSKENFVFRIMTTAPRCYVVNPNCSILESKKTIKIEITLAILREDNIFEDNKFQIKFAPTNENSSSKMEPSKIFDKVDKKLIFSYKLGVS
jgi:hypothetical protein